MGIITRKDLNDDKYDYVDNTTGGDDPEYTGKLDQVKLNRKEAYEVVDFINAYCEKMNHTTKKSAQKVEDMIHKAPEEKQSKATLAEWITFNWPFFQ